MALFSGLSAAPFSDASRTPKHFAGEFVETRSKFHFAPPRLRGSSPRMAVQTGGLAQPEKRANAAAAEREQNFVGYDAPLGSSSTTPLVAASVATGRSLAWLRVNRR